MPALGQEDQLPETLLLDRSGSLETFYAPFDHINREARIIICGITPGMQQARNALNAARACLAEGQPYEIAMAEAKKIASFSGPMRRNLVELLDGLGLQNWLGIDSCQQLFGSHSHLAHYTSALRYPVFVNGKDYNGTPSMLKQASLRRQIETSLSEEVSALSHALFVPLGPRVAEVFQQLVTQGLIDDNRVLAGIPHPSGANAERIAYFLGRKPREALSNKVNPDKLDRARRSLCDKITALSA
ncbi:hypothetical protein HBJ58_18650 [Halomonas desiderata]|nr:hypothetical protein [Halomonas desiderata]